MSLFDKILHTVGLAAAGVAVTAVSLGWAPAIAAVASIVAYATGAAAAPLIKRSDAPK